MAKIYWFCCLKLSLLEFYFQQLKAKIISARKLYLATSTSRLTTLNNVAEHIAGNNTKNITILPPASGDTDQDCDTENISDNFDNGDAIFESFGELEFDDFVNSSTKTEEEADRPTSYNRRKHSTPKWKRILFLEKKSLFKKFQI